LKGFGFYYGLFIGVFQHVCPCRNASEQGAGMDQNEWPESIGIRCRIGSEFAVLYIMIAGSFIPVFVMAGKKEIPFLVALPFILNLSFNFAFTPLQFGLKNNLLAAADILLILSTLVWAMIAVWPYARWITYMQIPYLLWVAFATVLQLTITWINR